MKLHPNHGQMPQPANMFELQFNNDGVRIDFGFQFNENHSHVVSNQSVLMTVNSARMLRQTLSDFMSKVDDLIDQSQKKEGN